MASITLKALPTSLHRALKSRASRHKRSLNQEVITMLEETIAPSRHVDVEAMLAREKRFRARLHFTTTPKEMDAYKRQGRL
jgi:plasmid stability protein